MFELKTLGNQVIVEDSHVELDTPLPAGLVRPDTAQNRSQFKTGIVLAVGEGKIQEDGSRLPLDVQVGQRVAFAGKYAGTLIKIGGKLLRVLEEPQCLATVE